VTTVRTGGKRKEIKKEGGRNVNLQWGGGRRSYELTFPGVKKRGATSLSRKTKTDQIKETTLLDP